MTPTKYNILTNDPSFTAWGWAIVTNQGEIVETGCIKTEPEHKKTRIRASDDRTRRALDITAQLIMLIRKHQVRFLLSESPHGSQNANAAIMIGIVTGITCALSEALAIPIEYYSEQDSKKHLLGKKSATKDETIQAIQKLFPNYKWSGKKYVDEAVADALAVYVVALSQSPTLKFMKLK